MAMVKLAKAWLLVESREFDAARAYLVAEGDFIGTSLRDPASKLRMQWIEARLVWGDGDLQAVGMLGRVCTGFHALGYGREEAIAKLEMAVALAQLGHRESAAAMASASLERFRKFGSDGKDHVPAFRILVEILATRCPSDEQVRNMKGMLLVAAEGRGAKDH